MPSNLLPDPDQVTMSTQCYTKLVSLLQAKGIPDELFTNLGLQVPTSVSPETRQPRLIRICSTPAGVTETTEPALADHSASGV